MDLAAKFHILRLNLHKANLILHLNLIVMHVNQNNDQKALMDDAYSLVKRLDENELILYFDIPMGPSISEEEDELETLKFQKKILKD